MTKNKLFELIRKTQKKELTIEDIISLKELSDEDIDIVLNNKNKSEFISLLKNENFKMLPKEEREEILLTLTMLRESSVFVSFIIKAATNKNIIDSGNLLEIVKMILKSKGLYQANYILSIASNTNCIASGKVIDLCRQIYNHNCNNEILEIAFFAAKDTHILRSGEVVEVVKEILSVSSKKTALKIYYKYVNEFQKITLLDAMRKDAVEWADFWTYFSEEPELAVTLLMQIKSSEEINPNEKITKELLGYSKTRKK